VCESLLNFSVSSRPSQMEEYKYIIDDLTKIEISWGWCYHYIKSITIVL